MMRTITFFLAGTVQGSRTGQQVADQTYRERLRELITSRYPDAQIWCPVSELRQSYAQELPALASEFARLESHRVLEPSMYPASLQAVRNSFRDHVARAAAADVVIAYLPGREASMGTAMEIWSAFAAGRPIVIVISEMKQHLALLATASVLVSSIEDFADLLDSRWLDELLEMRTSPVNEADAPS